MRAVSIAALAWIGACAAPVEPAAHDADQVSEVQSELACAERLMGRPLPVHFPERPHPADNPESAAKLALGRRLFYERRLSVNGEESCASCHQQALAFTDGRPRARGTTGQVHKRSSIGLANVAYQHVLTWTNPVLHRLEDQALLPMFGERPVELGTPEDGEAVLDVLVADRDYRRLFDEAFAGVERPISLHSLVQALAAFERELISMDSPYDRYLEGDRDALDSAAQRGLELFRSERLGCAGCHAGFNLDASGAETDEAFQNTALYNEDGNGAYPESPGLSEFTGRPDDQGRFRIPSLRNVALTAPYMHDGSVETLDLVLDHYANGGRSPDNPWKSPRLRGFSLEPSERADLLAFLSALTDETFVREACLADPLSEH